MPNAPFANVPSPGPKAIKPTTWFKYFYNGRGERVMMQQSLLLQDTSYVYDEAGHHLGKYLGSSTKSAGEEVIYLDDMPIEMTIGGVLSYLETDHLGTPRIAASPATNALQWEWDFFGDAFGDNAATSALSGGIDVRLRYPGQYFDGESGLHYNYFRDYEPGTGRYVESDPVGLEAGTNTYGYVGQNPTIRSDRFGLDYWLELARPLGLHARVCVGRNPSDPSRICISFGANDGQSRLECIVACQGTVYLDDGPPGIAYPGDYRHSSAAVDFEIANLFLDAHGRPGLYSVLLNNCQSFSANLFEFLSRKYGGGAQPFGPGKGLK